MEILLITGFLGAGKTTLIKHLLQSGFDSIVKVAVIVNEVGTVGIDGEVIRKETGKDINLIELTSGCICCTIKSAFLDALQEIQKRVKPTHLIVEATGIAQPGDMFELLCRYQEKISASTRLRSIITVVDAGFFEAREALGSFYDNQVKCADYIILNKIDQTDADELKHITAELSEMNPGCPILPVNHCVVDPDALLNISPDNRYLSRRDHFPHQHVQGGFSSFTFEDPRLMDELEFNGFLESLSPNLFRCKGWVRFPDGSKLLDYVGDSFRYKHYDQEHDTALVFVGRNLDEEAVVKALDKCFVKRGHRTNSMATNPQKTS